MSTTVAETDDGSAIQQQHYLIMNVMGIGTFLILFFGVMLAIVWFLSYSCAPVVKSVWRGVTGTLFVLTALILWYAPRSNRFENNSLEPAVSRDTYFRSYIVELF